MADGLVDLWKEVQMQCFDDFPKTICSAGPRGSSSATDLGAVSAGPHIYYFVLVLLAILPRGPLYLILVSRRHGDVVATGFSEVHNTTTSIAGSQLAASAALAHVRLPPYNYVVEKAGVLAVYGDDWEGATATEPNLQYA
ncbi:hypothetical protein U9M48_008949 [Paspalum notatum var. saurae]|uniref:Uncharacterized protein n=1 Tax=Paspalum notatum var. saurae TaxID=547442 RepID=A0AAQ3WE93_PASNO